MSKLRVLSSTDQKILDKTVSGARFKNIEITKHLNIFSKSVYAICAIVGVKDVPDSATLILLLTSFSERYSLLTTDEFIYAFHLNFYNEYPDRHEHFNSFDLNYMTKVLESYAVRLREAYANYKPAIPEEKRLEVHVPTDKEYYETLIQYIEKNKQLPFTWNWLSVFNHMEESGMITETDEELKAFKLKIKQEVKTDATFKKLKAADVIERNQIEDSLKNLSAIYKTEYVKMKFKP